MVELDVSDCSARPVALCNVDAVTRQDQLDGMLDRVIPLHHPARVEIVNGWLTAYFEGGCPERFYVVGPPVEQRALTEIVREALRDVRWSCAMDLGCAIVRGPDTLQ